MKHGAQKKQDPVAIHDHFDGSAHCVECAGPCQLTGAERHLTSVIRWMFERAAIVDEHPALWGLMRDALVDAGLDVERHWKRARETHYNHRR